MKIVRFISNCLFLGATFLALIAGMAYFAQWSQKNIKSKPVPLYAKHDMPISYTCAVHMYTPNRSVVISLPLADCLDALEHTGRTFEAGFWEVTDD